MSSRHSVHAFIDQMKSDGSFRETILGMPDVDQRIQFARASGFDITASDLRETGENAGSIGEVTGLECCGGQDCRAQDIKI